MEISMGQLVDGVWHDVWYDTKASGGAFVRTNAKFRNWITADGSAGPTGEMTTVPLAIPCSGCRLHAIST